MHSLEPVTRGLPEHDGLKGDPERVVRVTRRRVSLRESLPPAAAASPKPAETGRAVPRWSWWRLAERLLGGWPVSLRVAVLLAAGSAVAAAIMVAELGPLGAGLLAGAVAAFGIGRHTR